MNYQHKKALVSSRKKARRIVTDQEYVDLLSHEAEIKSRRYRDQLVSVKKDLDCVIRMLKSISSKGYRGLSLQDMVLPAAVLMYFINPLDLVPDFLVGPGLLDDMAIMTSVFFGMRSHLEKFRKWEKNSQQDSPPVSHVG